jgi:hypothetical protein
MWVLYLSVLALGALNAQFALGEGRVDVGIPLGIFDVITITCLVAGCIFSLRQAPKGEPAPARHALLLPALLLFGVSALASAAVAISSGTDRYYILNSARDYLEIPIGALAGWSIVRGTRDCFGFVRAVILTGGLTAVLVLVYFFQQGAQLSGSAEELSASSELNTLRSLDYGNFIADISAAWLVYSFGAKVRILGFRTMAALAALCIVGAVAPLHRSDWVSLLAAFSMIPLLLPPGQRGRIAAVVGIGVPVVAGALVLFAVIATQALSSNFGAILMDRADSLLPDYGTTTGQKMAYDSRLPGMESELALWEREPILGAGFGYDHTTFADPDVDFRHNAWTSTLAQNGALGFICMTTVILGMIVIGIQLVRFKPGRPEFAAVGALGAVSGTFFVINGLTTYSFNHFRMALFVGFLFGIVCKARALQLAPGGTQRINAGALRIARPQLTGGAH